MIFYFHMVLGIELRAVCRLERGGLLPLSYIPSLVVTGFFESVVQADLEFVILLPHPLQCIEFPMSPRAGWKLAF